MLRHLRSAPLALLLSLAFACDSSGTGSPWDDESFTVDAAESLGSYAQVVVASYADTITAAEAMQSDIRAFLGAPSEAGLNKARASWLAAREIYGQTEVYRFYGGPIDDEANGYEGQINAWPMDEVYIDYVEGDPDGGIINDPGKTIDFATLIALNGAGGEDDISTGWHAIEFLLWGQDLAADGPGARPWTDYVIDGTGSAQNQDRRRDYLEVVTMLLINDLKAVSDAWAAGADYHDSFVQADPKDSLTKILFGMGSLSGAELSGERMRVAFETREQEDEHSCFSDNTHRDLYTNALGIENVYLASYGGKARGVSLSQLVAARDPDLDTRLKAELRASIAAIEAIPAPFDQAIQAPADDPANRAVAAAITALQTQTKTIVEVATLLDITLNLEE